MIHYHANPFGETHLSSRELQQYAILEVHLKFTKEDLQQRGSQVSDYIQTYWLNMPYLHVVWWIDDVDTIRRWLSSPLKFSDYMKLMDKWKRKFTCMHIDFSKLELENKEAFDKNAYYVIETANKAFSPPVRITLPKTFEVADISELTKVQPIFIS